MGDLGDKFSYKARNLLNLLSLSVQNTNKKKNLVLPLPELYVKIEKILLKKLEIQLIPPLATLLPTLLIIIKISFN